MNRCLDSCHSGLLVLFMGEVIMFMIVESRLAHVFIAGIQGISYAIAQERQEWHHLHPKLRRLDHHTQLSR